MSNEYGLHNRLTTVDRETEEARESSTVREVKCGGLHWIHAENPDRRSDSHKEVNEGARVTTIGDGGNKVVRGLCPGRVRRMAIGV